MFDPDKDITLPAMEAWFDPDKDLILLIPVCPEQHFLYTLSDPIVECPSCRGSGFHMTESCCQQPLPPRPDECCGYPEVDNWPCTLCDSEGRMRYGELVRANIIEVREEK